MKSSFVEFKFIKHCLSLVVVAAALFTNSTAYASEWKAVTNPPEMPEFKLVDQHGNDFNNGSLSDRWTLVLIGFTSCPDVCPYTLGNLAHVIEETSSRVTPGNIPQVAFLAVDPERDQDILATYVAHFNDEFLGVTGDKDNIDKLVEGLDAFYKFDIPKKAHGHGSHNHGAYDVKHSADVRVLDPSGRLVATLVTPMDAYSTADLLLKLQVEYRKNL